MIDIDIDIAGILHKINLERPTLT